MAFYPKRGIQMLGMNLTPIPNTPVAKIEVSIVHKPAFGRNPFERLFIDTIKKIITNINRE